MNPATLLYIMVAAGGLYLWNLGRAATNLVYIPGNITGLSLAGLTPQVTATLVVQNTSNLEFTINSLAANVLSNGTQIGYISSFTPVVIQANSETRVPITMTLQPIGLVNEITSIITGGVGTREIVVDGSINANGIQAPLSIEYKIGA